MKIAFVGAGNAAWNLAIALHEADYAIELVYNRTFTKAEALAKVVRAIPISDFEQLNRFQGDLIIISTRDDGYAEVAKKLKTNVAVVHTSGSIAMEVLQPCSPSIGVFYPLQTMVKTRATDFSLVPFCLEANTEKLLIRLELMAQSLSSKIFRYDSLQRKQLHLAAIFASNFSNYLYILANEYLNKNSFPTDILNPLIIETANRIQDFSPAEMQTGPAKRGDWSVINSHLAMLAENHNMAEVYKLMSNAIMDYYQRGTPNLDGSNH
jgi:predicted short-subunit dehydrogenase-like oxidoreductase (DUF2520 family)